MCGGWDPGAPSKCVSAYVWGPAWDPSDPSKCVSAYVWGGWDPSDPSKCVSAYVWGAGTQVFPVSVCGGGWDPSDPSKCVWGAGTQVIPVSVWGGAGTQRCSGGRATQEYTRRVDVYIVRIELFKRCPCMPTYIVMAYSHYILEEFAINFYECMNFIMSSFCPQVLNGSTIRIEAFDADQPNTQNSRVLYSLRGVSAPLFNIDFNTGIVTVAPGNTRHH